KKRTLDKKGCRRRQTLANLLRQAGGILVRGQILPPYLRSVWPAPVVALFAERHQQGIPEAVVLRQGIARNSDDHLVLRDVHPQRSVESVPPGKYGAEVRVVLSLDLRVVDTVHARSDEHLIEQAFGTERKPNVAV